jgi:hypothetical protein
MPNEFIIREGFDNTNNVIITGSLTVTGEITGSLVSASYAFTSSISQNTVTASLITNVTSASYSVTTLSSSYAVGTYVVTNDVTTSFALPRIDTIGIGQVGLQITSSLGGMIHPFHGPYGWQVLRFNPINPVGVIYVTPITTPSTITAKQAGVVCFGGTANNSGRIDIGIYSSLNSMLPGNLLASARISGSILTTSASLYTASLSSNVVLEKDNIYWLAMVMSGSSGQNFYSTYQWTTIFTSWISVIQNKMYNPLLGIHIPNSEGTYRHVAYYTTSSTIELPNTMPSSASSYSVLSYGTRISTPTLQSNIPIPPCIFY